ncbi:MAG: tail fiber domain-containing protein [Bacteroidetes bacterium]|nr:tail fiber domain-containing protein [Bacteroidota bacterium]
MVGGSGSGWSLTGNSGTDAGTSFIGTTDIMPLTFRVNNQQAGKIDYALFNTSLGYKALSSTTTGHSNVAYGTNALFQNTTRSNLVAIGDSALYNNGLGVVSAWDATGNTAVGSKALFENTSGYDNTANGYGALHANSTGIENTVTGVNAMVNNTTGTSGTAIGTYALSNSIGGTNLTGIGWNANVVNGYMDDANAIGFNALVNANGTTMIGDIWQNQIGGWCGWTNYSDGRFKTDVKEDVKGLGFILMLRPVTYNFENRKLEEYLISNFSDSVKQRYRDSKHPGFNASRKTGFVAQEVETTAKFVGYDFDGVHVPANENDTYSLAYEAFVVPLVKAVQEQQEMIDELKKENAALKARMEALESKLNGK